VGNGDGGDGDGVAMTGTLLDLAGEAIASRDETKLRLIVVLLEQRLAPRVWRLASSALQFLEEGEDGVALQLLAHCADAARPLATQWVDPNLGAKP
jgi:hypothetical protein